MAKVVWETVGRAFCEHRHEEAQLLEQRVYPDEALPDAGMPYQVRARKCSFDIDCNLAGYPCCCAGTNPGGRDPFAA